MPLTRFYWHNTGPLPLRGVAKIQSIRTSFICHIGSCASVTHYSQTSLAVISQLDTLDPLQRSDKWFALRKEKLTSSTFSTALGFWKGDRRPGLWHEKLFELSSGALEWGACTETASIQQYKNTTGAMEWGVRNEAVAIQQYKSITGHGVSSLGFAQHSKAGFDWLGASPDGLLGRFPSGGILEVKCPYNKGKPENGMPWSAMPFYYMPQVQGLMEVMDREWADLYCWTPKGSSLFRVWRDRSYWEMMHGMLKEFWWEHVIPAREALVVGNKGAAMAYKPSSEHKMTGIAIFKSIKLAGEAKLLHKEIAGHTEYACDEDLAVH